MYSVELLLQAISKEFSILKHLWTKVTSENQHHTITEGTRTAYELIKYLAFEAPAQINLIAQGGRDADLYKTRQDKGADFTYDQFWTALDNAYAYIETTIKALTPEQLDEHMEMRGMKGTKTVFLVNYFLVFLGVYKEQLFLILKASWLKTLGTWNLWAGMDEPQKA
jgi:hypothetical protein